jgi:uncharacterized protein (DUF58 family)
VTVAQRLIPPSTLAELANLQLLARTVVEGTLTGLHRSPRFGFSQEFAEYRPYVPGDDLRFIDWNVLARTDKAYVKRFFGDTNTRLMVLLDTSASMGIEATRGAVRKIDYGRYLAAALIYLAARQHDAVGLAAFARDVRAYRAPSARVRATQALYHLLDALEAAGETNWGRVLDHAAAQLAKRSLVVLISDFFCAAESLASRLRGLAAHGHDLLMIHVLDPAEQHPAVSASDTLQDVETGAMMTVAADDLQRGYQQRLREHLRSLEQVTLSAGGHYLQMSTDQPLDRGLGRYLRFRERHP